MQWFSFGEDTDQSLGYKSVDENVMRTSTTVMLLLGLLAFTNGFMMRNYAILPYITGFMMFNFFIGVVINSKFAPTVIIARFLNRKKDPLLIGAIQKHFAWSLGFVLSSITFVLTLMLQSNEALFEIVCFFCIFCNTIMYFESVLGLCLGCKLYFLALDKKLIKAPLTQPRCMGNSCEIN